MIIDSSVIMEYAEEVFEQAPRFAPADPLARATMRSLMRFIDEVPTPAVRVPSYQAAFLRHFRSMSEEGFVALAESKPRRKEFLLSMGRTGFPPAQLAEAEHRLRRGVQRIAATIRRHGGPWLLDHLTPRRHCHHAGPDPYGGHRHGALLAGSARDPALAQGKQATAGGASQPMVRVPC